VLTAFSSNVCATLFKADGSVEQATGETYNFALVNYYATGSDSISFHSDSEHFLGPEPCVASISLGGAREFQLRHVKYKELSLPTEKFTLHDGDMVVMRGRTQHDWQHSIPKRKSAEGRINITFRKGIVEYATRNYNTYNVGRGNMFRWVNGEMVEQI
jgi:alkylated DNA repair dioxygenase AlkB